MKKLYIIAAGFFALFAAGCDKDDSTSADHPLPPVTVTGLQETYDVFTRQDILRIHPQVEGESRYDFFWTAFTTNFIQGNAPRPDTLAKTKDLDYEVTLNPGQYILVFNVRDKKTSVTRLINMTMNVSTQNMNGWYMLKETPGGKTDIDFFYDGGRIDNWISFFNGQSLDGKPVTSVFTPSFKTSFLPNAEIYHALTVLSDKDAAIIRIDNGKTVLTFDDMFFTRPAVKRPQAAFQPVAANSLNIINDGKGYHLNKGARFSNMTPPAQPYKLSPMTLCGGGDMGFDENTRSVVLFSGLNHPPLGSNGNDLKNTNADLLWMTGYSGSRSVGLILFRQQDGTGLLVKLNITTGPVLYNSGTLVTGKTMVPQSHGFMNASVRCGNYDADYMYYAIDGNKVYMSDVASLQESLQVTLPAGETITGIQHIKYPQPGTGVINTLNKLVVTSYSNGRYKVWIHAISSTGTIQPLAEPAYEGEGRVAKVMYMEKGLGSRIF